MALCNSIRHTRQQIHLHNGPKHKPPADHWTRLSILFLDRLVRERFDKNKVRIVSTTYDSYPYAVQRANALRYLVLWQYGGIYIDLDIGCRRSLDPLVAFPASFPSTWPLGVSNDLIFSTAEYPLLMKLSLEPQDHNFVSWSKYITVFWSTGPMFVNNILASCFRASHINNQDLHWGANNSADISRGTPLSLGPADGVVILPPRLYSTSEHSFFGHYPGSSWHGQDIAFATWFH
jgi:mannosyltransferase OCH1-like enzyme